MNLEKSLHGSFRQSPFSKKTRLLQREDTLNLSPILNDSSMFKTFNDTSLRQVLDDSSLIVGPGNPGEGLSEAFFEIIQTIRQSDILDILKRLSQVCCDTLELVEPWNRYNAQNYWLAEEANTWKLIYALYSDSISGNYAIDENKNGSTLSQHTLVNGLFKSDVELRLLQLLVDWLECSAAYQDEATKTSTVPAIGNSVHWDNTLHYLLIGTSLFNKEKSTAMVTCMDPDAPKRQKKAIHSDDQQDDSDLCKRIFKEIRCGKFEDAISMCVSSGQAWRGAVLQGWRLVHYESQGNSLEITGNPNRDLWKLCCLGIANNKTENIHYRAVVGVLCGHLGSTLPACQGSWEDLLWAHLRVQIEARVEKFLQEDHSTAYANTTPLHILERLQSEHVLEEINLQQVFGAVNALMDGKKESQYQTCQKHLILGQIRAIMQDSLQWIENEDDRFIRFLAHLILILRKIGKDPEHDIGDKILITYVSQLIRRLDSNVASPEMIAYYASTVPTDCQIDLYADLMDEINKEDHRQRVVKAGLDAGIDVAASARVAIKKIIKATHHGYGNVDISFTQKASVEKDKAWISKVISSLQWLGLLPNEIQEALWLSNSMIRTFIFIRNTEAATEAIESLSQMFPNYLSKISPDSSELREHHCLKTYLEALEGFASWHRYFYSRQPKKVEPLAPDATFSDKIHHEQMCAKLKEETAQWETKVLHNSQHTKKLLYNVLLYPGGWLQDENDGTSSNKFSMEENEERAKQLDTLRSLCIPEVIILILKILQSSKNVDGHKEAIKLSDIIAAENHSLYKVFTKDKLIEVLDAIRESSLVLLENGLDMFGYEINDE